MKILSFNIRDEQKPFVDAWVNKNHVEVKTVPYGLTLDTVSEVKGYDGITIAEGKPFDSKIFPLLKEYGIRNLAQRTAGYDNFDLAAAKESGIIFTNVAAYSPESIAEFTLYMALKLIRKGTEISERCQHYDFRWTEAIRGRVMREMTIGVVGTGRIGFDVAQLFHGMGCKVIAYDPYPNDQLKEFVTYKNSVESLVQESDIVTLHIPSTDQNFHMFDAKMFSLFKPQSYLINAARGKLVDTQALIEALDTGHLAGAALDTYEGEAAYIPAAFTAEEIKDPLFLKVLHHPKIDFTNHIAYYTDISVQNMIWYALDSTLEIIKTGTTKSRLN